MKDEAPGFARALAQLLIDTAAAAPRLFAGQGDALLQLACSRDACAASVAVHVMAAAGAELAAASPDHQKRVGAGALAAHQILRWTCRAVSIRPNSTA